MSIVRWYDAAFHRAVQVAIVLVAPIINNGNLSPTQIDTFRPFDLIAWSKWVCVTFWRLTANIRT